MAKFILTEQQLKQITETHALISMLNESASFKDIVNKLKCALAAGVAAASLMVAIDNLSISVQEKNALKDMVENADIEEDKEDDLFSQKVDAVEQCIRYYMKLMGQDINKVQLSPEKMVEVCERKGFDLPLMLAQAKLESIFGLGDRCQRTNSVFSIGSWDNGEDKVSYPDVNDSIEPYVDLIQKDYLSNKTIAQLLQPNGFVNTQNKRFAQDPDYEEKVSTIRNKIMRKWPVLKQ